MGYVLTVGSDAVLKGIWSIADDNPSPNTKPINPPNTPMLNAIIRKITCTSFPENPVAFKMAIESIFSNIIMLRIL